MEEVHNLAHQHIGGRLGGHMGPSTYAGFDPIL